MKNTVRYENLSENNPAIFFTKDNGQEMAFLLMDGSEVVNVCEKISLGRREENIFHIVVPMFHIPLDWLEAFANQDDLDDYFMRTPMGHIFYFSQQDLITLQNYLNERKGGSNG